MRLWRKWIAYPLGWVAAVVAALLIVSAFTGREPTSSEPPMHHFHATYEASKVGDEVHLHITESISDTLTPNRLGITRVLIPHHDGQDVGLTNLDIRDAEGKEYPFERRELPNGDIELLIDRNDPLLERQFERTFDFRISYDLLKTVSTADDIQEIYLDVNGTEWPNGFESVRADLVIGPSLAGHLTGDAACYQGRAGSSETCTITRDGDTFSATLTGVGAYENMTIAVGLQDGTVADPLRPSRARSHGWWGIAGLLGIGLATLAVSLLTRRLVRNPAPGEVGIVTQFTPPDSLEPVLAADFLGVPERGAAAHLVWLATEGLGQVTSTAEAEVPAPATSLSPSERRAHREGLSLRWFAPLDGPAASKMGGYIRPITEALFGGPNKVHPLDRVRGIFPLNEAQHLRDHALLDKQLREQITFGPLMLWFGFLAILSYGLYQVWIGLAGLGWWFLPAGVIAVMLVLWAFHLRPVHGRLTERGLEMQRYLAGLERFVTTSEGERIRWMNNVETAPRDDESRVDLYEKLLPWAVVFGAEDSWRQVLGDMYSRFPERERQPAWQALTRPASWSSAHGSNRRRQTSTWDRRPDIGDGSLARGTRSFMDSVGKVVSGRGSSYSSTRSSGRGWGGGRSSSSRRGGSRGGGRSGGGRGGGGGGRR